MDSRKLEKNWTRMQRQAQEALEQAQDQAQQALGAARRMWDQARSGASDMASEVSVHGLKDRMSHAVSDVSEAAQPYWDLLGDRLEGMREDAMPYLKALRRRASELSHAAADRFEDWRDKAQGKWSEMRPMLSGQSEGRTEMSMGPILGLIGGGAGLMYLFDKEKGAARRSILCARSAEWLRKAEDSIDMVGTQLGDKIQRMISDMSMSSEASSHEFPTEASMLTHRIEDRLSRILDECEGLKVEARPNGRVKLSGPLCRHEVDRVLAAVSTTPGVTGIENELSLRDADPNEVKPWSPATRVMAGAGGAGLLLAGAKRGGFGGLLMTAVGAGLVARAALDRPMEELLDLARDRAMDMAEKAEQGWDELKEKSSRSLESAANHARS